VSWRKKKKCPKIPASFSMNVMAAKEFLNQSREIVAYFARTEQFPAPQNK
jgi:hypothetical protein